MTEYRNISVDKRSFSILRVLSGISSSVEVVVRDSDTRVTRNGDTRVTRNGDTRIAHGGVFGRPRLIQVAKRNFTILVNKLNRS